MKVDTVWRNARLATLTPSPLPYGEISQGLIACQDGQIVWAGSERDAPKFSSQTVYDLEGRWISPGLIDCHTHLIYAGNRTDEFEQRQNGVSYEEIARKGGGIASTVRKTRKASSDQLIRESLPRLKALLSEGVTTLEIKSGYGLDLETEIKMLKAAKKIGEDYPVDIQTSFLGAHALPKEYHNNADAYIDHLTEVMLPEIAKMELADAVDGFCETIGFSKAQIEKVFKKAKSLNLPVKLHAEQLSNQQGAKLAAHYQALSADHLEYLDEESIIAMKESNTCAVLLPGAFYYLNETQHPPLALLRKYNIPIALATDANPGTSPITSLLTIMNMGCVLFGLTPEEALKGVSLHAAQALGLQKRIGAIKPGFWCNLAVWDIETPACLSAKIGINLLYQRIYRGQVDTHNYH